MRWTAVALLLVAAAALRAAVDPGAVEAGGRALREQQWSEAETQLRLALQQWPDDPDLEVLLAIALYHRGDSRDAATQCERALAYGTEYEARALYYLGLARIDLHDGEGAQAAFARLVERFPDSAEAQKVREAGALTLKARQASSPGDHIGELLVLALAGWDSRPEEIADDAGAGIGASAYWLAHADFGMRFAPAHLNAGYTHLDYLGSGELDADSLRGLVDHAIYRDQDSYVPRYTVRALWLDHSAYEVRHDLSLRWNRRWDEAFESDVTPFAAWKSHTGAYRGEDGWLTGADARLTRHGLVERLPRLHAGLEADAFSARSRWFGWTEAALYAGAHATLGWWAEADLDLRLRERRYQAVDPVYRERRDDQRAELELTVERTLAAGLIAQLDTVLALNRSTIADYDFGRFAVSVGLIALH